MAKPDDTGEAVRNHQSRIKAAKYSNSARQCDSDKVACNWQAVVLEKLHDSVRALRQWQAPLYERVETKRQTNSNAITVKGQKPMLDNSIEKDQIT